MVPPEGQAAMHATIFNATERVLN